MHHRLSDILYLWYQFLFTPNGQLIEFQVLVRKNLHWIMEAHAQYLEQINVFVGIINNNIFGLYLSMKPYWTFLEPLKIFRTLYKSRLTRLYQDDNSNLVNVPFCFRQICVFLDIAFLNRCIGLFFRDYLLFSRNV